MNLQRRINKLQEEGKQVTVKHYSLFKLDSYSSKEVMDTIFVGLCFFVVILTACIWFGSNRYYSNQARSNPAVVQAQADKDKQKQEYELKRDAQNSKALIDAKNQYIQGCKDAGKAPTDMSEYDEKWSCK